MALDLKYAVLAKAAKMNALSTYAGASAKLRIYSGTKPATADTATGAAVMLSEHICNATAFAANTTTATLTANAVANGTGTAGAGGGTAATWYRLWKSDGTTPVLDGTVGTATSDLILDNTNIATGQAVSITSATYTEAN